MATGSVGCFGNKNKDVAESALQPPPPAAYPDSSSMAEGSGSAPGAVPSAPSPATVAATNRVPAAPAAPAPFELREGETLVPYQIQTGDNLSNIAAKHNSSIGRIMSANGMTDSKIFAGKTLQIPTSAPPTNLAQNGATAPAVASGAYDGAPATVPTDTAPSTGGAYPGTTTAPTVPSLPTTPSVPTTPGVSSPGAGAIAPPPLPPGASAPTEPAPSSIVPPGYPASTSYPRSGATGTGGFPTPSFEASRVQFSN